MKLTNLTRANEIGANCYLLDFDGDGRVLLDAGMHPRADGEDALPDLNRLPVDTLDAIFVSHAHHDHIGALPVVMREHPHARVFLSEPTYYLADPLLHNSVQIMKKQRLELGIEEYPLFGHREIDQYSQVWQAVGLGRLWSLQGYPDADPREALTFRFHDAGHILGSVGIELIHRGRRVFYTGDVNFAAQTLMKSADFPERDIDTLIIETTRGAQPRPEGYSRRGELAKLAAGINATFERGGTVLIPVFAMGKTQEVLTALHLMQERGEIPTGPIHIGGLSRAFTQIYDKLAATSRRAHGELQLMEDIGPRVMDGRKANQDRPRRGEIYLISSGMMTEKTLSNLFAQQVLSVERHGIFFVGYCDPESPAGRLLATPPDGKVELTRHGGEQPILCQVEKFDLTAHAQRDDLLRYILTVRPRVCVLVHGDPPALAWFQVQLREQAPEMKVVIPPPGEAIEL
ncbi:MAG: MBL fold metallo-hydrolase [Verrucomicrobiota bacterium]